MMYQELFDKIQKRLQEVSNHGYGMDTTLVSQSSESYRKALQEVLGGASHEAQDRMQAEYFSLGPLEHLMNDSDVTEILVNGPDAIWFEKSGRLFRAEDGFYSEATFRNCLQRMCEEAHCHSTVEFPASTGSFREFRMTLIRHELTQNQHHLSLRRHPKNPWTLEKLAAAEWATDSEIESLRSLMLQRKNFLIVGGTGSGKTSLINALLQTMPPQERAVIIEDVPEIETPNSASMKLVTREDPQGLLKSIDQSELVRHSLRLRPDRIVMGEIRGPEAKDLLMALASGHAGSFGTLHANDPRQALIRLEMLIQMGAPQWSLSAVRRLIQLSLEWILVVGKTPEGKRKFQGAYRIDSLEENGFLIERIF